MSFIAAAVIGGGAAIAGGMIAANGAKSAANAQANAAAQSDATQRYQYDMTRADNAPFLANGTAASNKLATLLGIAGTSKGNAQFTRADLIDTSSGDWRPNAELYASDQAYKAGWDNFSRNHLAQFGVNPNNARGSDLGVGISQLGYDLDAGNARRMAAADQEKLDQQADPQYGSLLRNFSAADMQADPVYQSGLQFGLDEGTKGVNRLAAASGSMLSGATLKALTRYGNDYASTKAGDSYNRYNANRDSTYNKLAGVSGSGQVASSQVGAAGQNMANNISQSQIGVGNARAASSIGQSNALAGAINQGASMWNSYNNFNNGFGGSGGFNQNGGNYDNELARMRGQL